MFLFSTLGNDLVNECNHLLIDFMCRKNCFDHLIFRYFICTGFDHDDFFSGRCNRQSHIRNLTLCGGRIEYELTIDQTYLCGSSRSVKRDIRNSSCDRRTKHCSQLRAAVRVNRHNHVVQSYIVAVIFREKRTHRTINDTGCQDRIFRSLSFTFVEAARNLSNGIHFLFVFHTQREEINPFTRLFGCSSG